MYWYILFVKTGQENKVEQLLKKRLDSNVFIPFIPLHERIFKIAGIIKKEIKPLFPGYVFIESDVSNMQFTKSMNSIIHMAGDIIGILKYSDTEISIKESEKQMLLSLCNDNYCIEASTGIIEGDKIYVTDGPLKGRESIVKKVDRHKRLTWIEIELMGETRLISLSLEVVHKLKTNSELEAEKYNLNSYNI